MSEGWVMTWEYLKGGAEMTGELPSIGRGRAEY